MYYDEISSNLEVYYGHYAHPSTLSQAVESKLVCDLGGIHGILWCVRQFVLVIDSRTYWQILLVGKNQENGIPQLILVQHALQLLSGLNNTIAIIAVDNEDDALGVLEVMPPQRPDLVLSTNIPHGELDILILDRLNVEA